MGTEGHEGYVQVAPDSTGKQIRNFKFLYTDANGALQTAYMQCVAITDAYGNEVDFGREVLIELLEEQRKIRRLLEMLASFTGRNTLLVEDKVGDKVSYDRRRGDELQG